LIGLAVDVSPYTTDAGQQRNRKNTRPRSNDVLSAPLKRDLSTVAMRRGVAVRVVAQSGAKKTETKPGQIKKDGIEGDWELGTLICL